MSSSFRELAQRVGAMAPPDIDVDDLISKGEARLRLRRAVALVGTTVVVALAVLAAAAMAPGHDRSTLPVSPPELPSYSMVPDLVEPAPLVAGWHALTPIGPRTGPLAVVEIPDGYVGGPLIFPADRSTGQADECCIVGFWTVARVYQDPCKARAAKDPGPSVQDLADALVAQRTTATKPTPVTLGGYQGLYLELTAPPGLGDLSSCKGGDVAYWESDPGTRYFSAPQYHAGMGLPVDRVWILDVEGQRVVLDAGVASGIDDQQAQPLIDIVESTQFVTQ